MKHYREKLDGEAELVYFPGVHQLFSSDDFFADFKIAADAAIKGHIDRGGGSFAYGFDGEHGEPTVYILVRGKEANEKGLVPPPHEVMMWTRSDIQGLVQAGATGTARVLTEYSDQVDGMDPQRN
jgi:hypothetical protein